MFLASNKGFTLFTALVSFVLIATAYLLVQSMMLTEESTRNVISAIDEQTEMQAIADMARADALQEFNYGVRYQLELWLTEPTAEFYIMTPERANDWQGMIDSFARDKFTTQLPNRAAAHLTNKLNDIKSYKGYLIKLESRENELREVLITTFTASINAQNFLKPIDCSESNCNTGTFYVNMDLTQLSDADYEKFPQITVTSQATGRTIKEPILPKSNVQIYVPLRIFKALWKAKEIANASMFSTRFSESLGNVKLGFCDSGKCYPRENPIQTAPKSSIDTHLCPGEPRSTLLNFVYPQGTSHALDCSSLNIECPSDHYDPSSDLDMVEKLEQIMQKLVSSSISSIPNLEQFREPEGLDVVEFLPLGSFNVTTGASAVASKKIIAKGSGAGSGEGTAKCIVPKSIKAIITFREKNKNYWVSEALTSHDYKIELYNAVTQSTASQDTCYSICGLGSSFSPTACPNPKCSPSQS